MILHNIRGILCFLVGVFPANCHLISHNSRQLGRVHFIYVSYLGVCLILITKPITGNAIATSATSHDPTCVARCVVALVVARSQHASARSDVLSDSLIS